MNKPTVDIELDKPRKLLYDFNALILVEELTGKKMINREADAAPFIPNTKDIRSLAYAGLVHEDPTLTEQYVGSLIFISNVKMVSDKVMEAIALASGVVVAPLELVPKREVIAAAEVA